MQVSFYFVARLRGITPLSRVTLRRIVCVLPGLVSNNPPSSSWGPFFLLFPLLRLLKKKGGLLLALAGWLAVSQLGESSLQRLTWWWDGRSRQLSPPFCLQKWKNVIKKRPKSRVLCRQRLVVLGRLPTAQMWHFSIPDHPATGLRHDAVGFTCVGNPGQWRNDCAPQCTLLLSAAAAATVANIWHRLPFSP